MKKRELLQKKIQEFTEYLEENVGDDPEGKKKEKIEKKKDPVIMVKPKEKKKVIVAIDAGHGGEDPGAIGKYGTKEKKIVLQITKRLKKLINSDPSMKAYLIRDSDYYIPLNKRVSKARKVKADIFISMSGMLENRAFASPLLRTLRSYNLKVTAWPRKNIHA